MEQCMMLLNWQRLWSRCPTPSWLLPKHFGPCAALFSQALELHKTVVVNHSWMREFWGPSGTAFVKLVNGKVCHVPIGATGLSCFGHDTGSRAPSSHTTYIPVVVALSGCCCCWIYVNNPCFTGIQQKFVISRCLYCSERQWLLALQRRAFFLSLSFSWRRRESLMHGHRSSSNSIRSNSIVTMMLLTIRHSTNLPVTTHQKTMSVYRDD